LLKGEYARSSKLAHETLSQLQGGRSLLGVNVATAYYKTGQSDKALEMQGLPEKTGGERFESSLISW